MSENNHFKEISLAKQEFMKFVHSLYPLDKTYKCDESKNSIFSSLKLHYSLFKETRNWRISIECFDIVPEASLVHQNGSESPIASDFSQNFAKILIK